MVWSFGVAGSTVGFPVALPVGTSGGAVGFRVVWSFGVAGSTVGFPVALPAGTSGDAMVSAGTVAVIGAPTKLGVGDVTPDVVSGELVGLAAETVAAARDELS